MRGSKSRVLGLALVAHILVLQPCSQLSGAAAATGAKINGWYPCHKSLASHQAPPSAIPPFECAEVQAPLCHEGICSSDKSIGLFVKRLVAEKPMTPRKAMWFLQGGPGSSSATLESLMLAFNATTQMTVDMYTLDHRGTGRSNYLECQAAQAFAAGSPGGTGIDVFEIPNCIQDIMFQIDNHTEAFSVTSAAKDVEYLIDMLHGNATDVFVYGGSYGTYWGERLMHLAPTKVKGYILDGVVDEKADAFSSWNANRRLPEARFIQFCEEDKFCSSKLSKEITTHGGLTLAIRALYNRLDAAEPGKDKCADLMRDLSFQAEKPSRTLRNVLGWWVYIDPARILVPAILHRVYRCSSKDVEFLKSVFGCSTTTHSTTTTSLTAETGATSDPVMANSQFLGSLIIASELWATPSPSWANEMRSYDEGLFSVSAASRFDYTCFFRGNFSDPMCEHLIKANPGVDFTKLKTTPFVYKPDKYWKKYAPIPSYASTMAINGGLDFQTPRSGGAREYEGLQGEGDKMLVEFDTGGHGAGVVPATASDKSRCGYTIITSYVLGGGDVSKVDTSCLKKLPAIDFADLEAINTRVAVTSADELYDSL
ncbi:hypothetical protein Gpo141_00011315 [Globisporangium polare]